MIFDQDVRDSLSAIETYIKKGIVTEADTIEELAEQIGVSPEVLADTMKTYAEYQHSGTDEDFGRADMGFPLTTAKFYAAKCAPAIHHTMGGVKIDTTTAVLREDGTAISGLSERTITSVALAEHGETDGIQEKAEKDAANEIIRKKPQRWTLLQV